MTAQHAAVIRKATWRLLPFMFVLYIVSYLDRINISFAGLQMNRDLGFADDVFGFGGGIFFLGYFLFGVPSNIMVQKLGARKWIAAIMIVWGAISMANALITNALMLYVLRFLLGVAEAGFFPGMILYLTYWFPKRERGLAVARFMSAIPVAGVLGGVVAAQLLAMTGVLGLPGWKWLFICTGLPAVVLGAVVWFVLCDGPHEARWLNDEEKQLLSTLLEEDRKSAPGEPASINPLKSLVDPSVWLFALIYFTVTFGMYGFTLWLPQIIHGFGGLTDSQTALLSAVPAVFQALGMVVIASRSDRTGERRFHMAASALIGAAGLVLSAYTSNAALSLASLSLAAFGIWGTVGPFWAMPTGFLAPATAAAGIALINSVGNLGGFAGPYIVGIVKKHTNNFSFALDLMAASLIVAALLAITRTMRAAKPIPATATDEPE